jgi:hypothetical protein
MKINVLNEENNMDVLKLFHIINDNIRKYNFFNVYMNQDTFNILFDSGLIFEWRYEPLSNHIMAYMGNGLCIDNNLDFGEVALEITSKYESSIIDFLLDGR